MTSIRFLKPAAAAFATSLLLLGISLGIAAAKDGKTQADLAVAKTAASATDVANPNWAAGWRAAPQAAGTNPVGAAGLNHQTARMIVRSDATGNKLRIRLSNAFGASPVVVAAVSVAYQQSGPTIDARSSRSVTFNGQPSVTIPVGQESVSDPVPLSVRRGQNLVVSAYFPAATGPSTWHFEAESTTYLSQPGNWTSEPGGSPYQTITPSWYYLDGIDVYSHAAHGTIVAFGDSITDGHYSTIDANGRWPDWLARRIPQYSVINEGIGGNRVLTDTSSSGISALHRFDTDALNQPDVTGIIVLEGINDIQSADASAASVIDGLQQLIARAHARCIPIFGGTLTPFKGSNGYSADREQAREAVNAWIRTSGAFDGVVDFDKAVRDPADPLALLPAYDSGGGHLHPNDLGYEAMGNAVSLSMLKKHYSCDELR